MGPQQQQLASGAYSDFLQPYNQEGFQDLFKKSFEDPAQKFYQQQMIPSLKQSFLGLDESGSSSLNRALAQGASDLSSGIGQQYMNFFQQQQKNKLGALQGLGGLAGQRTFEPHIEKMQGILGPLIAALGQIGGGFAMGGPLGAAIRGLSGGSGLQDTINPGATAGPYGQQGNTYNPYTGVQGPYQPWRGF